MCRLRHSESVTVVCPLRHAVQWLSVNEYNFSLITALSVLCCTGYKNSFNFSLYVIQWLSDLKVPCWHLLADKQFCLQKVHTPGAGRRKSHAPQKGTPSTDAVRSSYGFTVRQWTVTSWITKHHMPSLFSIFFAVSSQVAQKQVYLRCQRQYTGSCSTALAAVTCLLLRDTRHLIKDIQVLKTAHSEANILIHVMYMWPVYFTRQKRF
jgi:hypothetical protein